MGSAYIYIPLVIVIMTLSYITIDAVHSYQKARTMSNSYQRTKCKVLQISLNKTICGKGKLKCKLSNIFINRIGLKGIDFSTQKSYRSLTNKLI